LTNRVNPAAANNGRLVLNLVIYTGLDNSRFNKKNRPTVLHWVIIPAMKWSWTTNPSFFTGAISSLILVIAVVFLRMLSVRAVLRFDRQLPEIRRRWIVNIRNASIFVLLVGLTLIWAQELRTIAVSFLALAVALVIATKELILCVSGAVIRTSTHSYSVGDRIEIAGKRGDVIDQNIFTTTLLEIGPGHGSHQYTGRAIVIPNSLLLNNPLTNESYTEDFVLHVFPIPLWAEEDWQKAELILLEAANIECAPFLQEARRSMERLENKHGLDSPTVAPRVTVQIPEPGKVNLLLRIPTPARRIGRLEQAILRRFLSEFRRLSVLGRK
jgi:small-conductance mechanosensitive channel